MNRKVEISKVIPGSIAEEAGIEKGDCIISINNENIRDVFDYRFLTANEELVLEIGKIDGDVWEIEIEKDEYEDLGIEFENSMMDEARSCTNKCVFCFIDQLPDGMRETLYFKDDDSRLSFLSGNYVTLTNVSREDIDRIIRYRMSPINISVHTTNPELRVSMLNNRFAGNILENIRRLVGGGITVNCQLVLCRGINDGQELEKSLTDLTEYYPGVNSISVVPVGLTRHRRNLTELLPYDKASSIRLLEQIGRWQKNMLDKFNSRVVYPADEFFIMAGMEIPKYEYYEEFPQIENGVGLLALFRQQFDECFEQLHYTLDKERVVSVATGISASDFIKGLAQRLEERYDRLKVYVYPVRNDFFGTKVTVTGLLTGRDILAQLKGSELGHELLLSGSMLRAGERVLLDDSTVEDIEKKLDVKIQIVQNDGGDFIRKVLGIGRQKDEKLV